MTMTARLLPLLLVLPSMGLAEAATAPQAECDEARLGQWVLDLFPPVDAQRRLEAVRELQQCRSPRAGGALGAVLASEDKAAIRSAAASALFSLGGDDAVRALEEAAEFDEDTGVAIQALELLASLGKNSAAGRLVQDREQPAKVRLKALHLIESSPSPLSVEQLEKVAAGNDALAREAEHILVTRSSQAARAPPRTTPAGSVESASAAPSAPAPARSAPGDAEGAGALAAATPAPARSAPGGAEGLGPPGAAAPPSAVANAPPSAQSGAAPAAPGSAAAPQVPPGAVRPAPVAPPPIPPALIGAPALASRPRATPPAAGPRAGPVKRDASRAGTRPRAAAKPSARTTSLGTTVARREPSPVRRVPAPVKPAAPAGPTSGAPLAIATSSLVGASLMSSLAMLAQQDGVGVLMLVGSAGAIIGGGTAWGLMRFGVEPDLPSALWYTNVTAWGTLAGLLYQTTRGSYDEKLGWGLLAGGQVLGVGAGIWSATRWKWTPQQTLLADSLVLSAGLLSGGLKGLRDRPSSLSAGDRIGTVPVYLALAPPAMIAAAVGSRYLQPTSADVHLLAASTLSLGWSGALVASGAWGSPFAVSRRSRGGLLTGMSLGYLAGAAAGAFVEVPPAASWSFVGGVLAGNLLGTGLAMAGWPDSPERFALGTGLGGLAVGTAGALAAPLLRPGPAAMRLMLTGALWGGATWGIAEASSHGMLVRLAEARRAWGGILASATGMGLMGLAASSFVEPKASFYPWLAVGSLAGVSAGSGIAKLAAPGPGGADFAGVLAGSALGLGAVGAAALGGLVLRPPDLVAAASGAGFGAFLGTLAPSLGQPRWEAGRRGMGGALLGAPVLAAVGAATSRLTLASTGDVGAAAWGGMLGAGLGTGIGWMLQPGDGSRAGRIGATSGVLGGVASAVVVERYLHLSRDLRAGAIPAAVAGASIGAADGLLVAALFDPSGLIFSSAPLRLRGGALMGASAGAAAGLFVSRYAEPDSSFFGLTLVTQGLGASLGAGMTQLASPTRGAGESAAMLAGSLGGLVAGATVARDLRETDRAAGLVGIGAGALLGTLAPSLAEEDWHGSHLTRGGALVGLAVGGVGAATASHALDASPAEVSRSSLASLLGLGSGLGFGLMMPTPSRQPARIGTVVGPPLLLGGSLLFGRTSGPWAPQHAQAHGFSGSALGIYHGLLLAWAVDGAASFGGVPTRQSAGGAMFGASAGLASGLALSLTLAPSADNVLGREAFAGTAVGGAFGRGLTGLVWSQPGRADAVGMLAGSATGLVTGVLLQERLEARDAHGDLFSGSALGLYHGVLLAWAIEGAGSLSEVPMRRRNGGALVGASGGLASGLALSLALAPPAKNVIGPAAFAGTALGSALGRGLSGIAWSQPGRPDAVGMLVGSAAGLTSGVLLQEKLEAHDVLAAGIGMGDGFLLGMLLPSLGDESWQRLDRRRAGWALTGAAGGAVAGIGLRQWTAASADALRLAALGSVQGLAAGYGAGVLADEETSQARRTGAALGTLGGLALGAGVWPRLSRWDLSLVGAATAVGGWNGALLGALGYDDFERVPGERLFGGLLAGAGLASITGALVGDVLRVDQDLLANALALEAVLSGAGLGAGLLASRRDDVAVGAMLGAGSLGLLLGGALHEHIEIAPERQPLLTLSALEGIWIGAWLPHVLYQDVTPRRRGGGIVAGLLGGLGTGAVLGDWVPLSGRQGGFLGLGTALGSAAAGGVSLLSPALSPKGQAALTLGGSALGLAGTALFGSRLSLGEQAIAAGGLGGLLGVSEALTFAWAGRSETTAEWQGAALIGASTGTTLGLLASSAPSTSAVAAPAAAGFAAWGAWMGAFTGSLFNPDAHEVTLGGLIGANVAFLGGYALLRSETAKPSDFGWLSLFGALGTLGGAGIGAPFSSKEDARPVLAGLAIGPAVGLIAGGLALPRLRGVLGSGSGAGTGAGAEPEAGAAEVASPGLGGFRMGNARRAWGIADWSPGTCMALWPSRGDPNDRPVLFGVSGRIW